jgi:hypothetical protein
MPSDAATLIWTASLIAYSGTHLLHQPVVRPADRGDDAELGRAGRGGLLGGSHQRRMSSQADRTGEVNWPDCEQKWQSSGQPPVLTETIPSTSTSGPHQRMRTPWASSEQLVEPIIRQLKDGQRLRLVKQGHR